jgi:hypothetical protein
MVEKFHQVLMHHNNKFNIMSSTLFISQNGMITETRKILIQF